MHYSNLTQDRDTKGGLFKHSNEPPDSIKCGGISWLAEEMLAAEEGLQCIFYIFLDYEFLVLIPATRHQHKKVRRVTGGGNLFRRWEGTTTTQESSYSQYMFMAGVTFLKNAT